MHITHADVVKAVVGTMLLCMCGSQIATELLLTMRAADAVSVVQVTQQVYQNELIFVRLEPK